MDARHDARHRARHEAGRRAAHEPQPRHAVAGPVMSLLTAVFTPFDEDGELALGTVERQAEALTAWGCPGVFVCGTAGEQASLTTAERMRLLGRWCEVAAAGRLDVIAHVGHTSLGEARQLAAHAQRAGASAIAAVAPYFHRPPNAAALADFLARLAEAAPELPLIYYHIPGVTGVRLPASEVLVAARERVPSFAGIKYADGDVADLQRCLALAAEGEGGKGCEVYVANARLVLAAAGLGVRAAIGSAYAFAAPLYLRMLRHVARGEADEARRCQLLAQTAIDVVARPAGELPGFKAAGALTGPDCGPCRPPLASLDAARRAALREELAGIGFLDAVAHPGAVARPAGDSAPTPAPHAGEVARCPTPAIAGGPAGGPATGPRPATGSATGSTGAQRAAGSVHTPRPAPGPPDRPGGPAGPGRSAETGGPGPVAR